MIIRILIIILFSVSLPTCALMNIQGGYSKPTGESAEFYDGSFGVELGLEIPLYVIPVALNFAGGYNKLGSDDEFKPALESFIRSQMPGGILPPQFNDLGTVNSSLYYGIGGLRYYMLDTKIVGLYVEPGVAYLYRDMDVSGVPLSTIGRYIPDFNIPTDAKTGFGWYVDAGTQIMHGFMAKFNFGMRFMYGPGVANASLEETLHEYEPSYEISESGDLKTLFFYGGLGFF